MEILTKPLKFEVALFHLNNRQVKHKIKIVFCGKKSEQPYTKISGSDI